MCGVVEVWASKRRHNPREGSRGHDENSFFFEIVLLWQSMWQWWMFGIKEAKMNGMKEAKAVSAVYFFFFFGSHFASLMACLDGVGKEVK